MRPGCTCENVLIYPHCRVAIHAGETARAKLRTLLAELLKIVLCVLDALCVGVGFALGVKIGVTSPRHFAASGGCPGFGLVGGFKGGVRNDIAGIVGALKLGLIEIPFHRVGAVAALIGSNLATSD